MATNDNEIGIYATLDVKQFEAGKARLDAMIASLDKNVTAYENKQKAAAAQSAQVAEQSSNKIATATKASAAAHTKSINQIVSGFRSAAFVLAGLTAAIVINYKKLDEAARSLGDTELVAQFDALDASVVTLSDTLMASELEFLRVADVMTAFTGIVETLRQSIAIATGSLVYMLELLKGLSKVSVSVGIKGLGSIGVGTGGGTIAQDMQDAKAAADAAFLNVANVPGIKQAAERQKEAEKEREKNSEKLADYISKIRDMQIKSGEDLLDAETDYQDKSASAWQSYIEKTNSIVADGIKKRAELARTYSDAIASAERDYQRGAEDAAYQHGNKLADIERDYQDNVRNIQQTYQEDALDAVRNLDAIGLIRAKEKRDKDLTNAAQSRDRANDAENQNYSRQLYELQRALEDKKREAEIAYQRGLDDQRRAEQEATQEAKDTLNQQNADAKRAHDERLAAINQAYTNERDAARAHYLNQEAALQAHMQAMRAIMAAYGIDTGGGSLNPIKSPKGGRRAEGGIDIVNQPTQFTAGEAGPEMAMFIPLNRSIQVSTPQVVNHMGDFSHNIDAAITSSVAGIDGRIMAAVRKALGEVIQ